MSVLLQRISALFTADGVLAPDVTTCTNTSPLYHGLVGVAMLPKNTAATWASVTGPVHSSSPGRNSVDDLVSTAHATTSDPAATESTCTRLRLTFSAVLTSDSTWETKAVSAADEAMTATGSASAKCKVTAEKTDGRGVGTGVAVG